MISKMVKVLLIAFGWMAVTCPRTPAQLLPTMNPVKTQCCSAIFGQRLADSLRDWPQLGRYYEDDQQLLSTPSDAARVVFLGDSITDYWNLAKFFPGKSYINRGINGQTTPQMLVRMYPDVLKLKPSVLVVLAGTNDIAGNTGPSTLTMIQDNYRAITELATLHGVKVILCSLTPVNDYTNTKQTLNHPPADILKLNQWLKGFAAGRGFSYVDYFSALADDQGMLGRSLSNDGLHPNEEGYKLMAPLVVRAIEVVLGQGSRPPNN